MNDIIKYTESDIASEMVLFFDMDGTLVDTNFANYLSYKKAIIAVTHVDYNIAYDSNNRFSRNNLEKHIANLSENDYARIVQAKEVFYKEFLHETKLNDYLVDVLSKYSKTNQTVLVTNCRQDRALEILNHHKLTDKFTNLFFRQIGIKGEIINKFQNAVSKLGIPVELIVAFENEEIEIADAIRAGIKNINPKIS